MLKNVDNTLLDLHNEVTELHSHLNVRFYTLLAAGTEKNSLLLPYCVVF
jgi:hypothetical protein